LGEGGSAANETDLKQGLGVVVGELWLLKCGRGRQIGCHLPAATVEWTEVYSARANGSLFGAAVSFIRRVRTEVYSARFFFFPIKV